MSDELMTFARRFRQTAAATLVQICSDEQAPPAARAGAATKILEYADGRPGIAKPITTADIHRMAPEHRLALLGALMEHEETRAVIQGLIQQTVGLAIAQFQAQPPPRQIGFRRGPRAYDDPITDVTPANPDLAVPPPSNFDFTAAATAGTYPKGAESYQASVNTLPGVQPPSTRLKSASAFSGTPGYTSYPIEPPPPPSNIVRLPGHPPLARDSALGGMRHLADLSRLSPGELEEYFASKRR
jgi:hypothetical protein